MKVAVLLVVHLLATVARLLGPGGVRGVMAESLLVKHQLLVVQRRRRRAPNLTTFDRVFAGLCCLVMRPGRVAKAAVSFRPATLFRFHAALRDGKYRRLFSARRPGKPGPKGPSAELIAAIVEMKKRNPRFGCPRIAQQIALAFGVDVDKDVVRRVLSKHFRPEPGGDGPSWLTFIGHMTDSLWSVDLFRCESILLQTHWVMLVMDHYTRRVVGFGVTVGDVDGAALCRMFNTATAGARPPKRVSTDNDPLFSFHRWGANLRVLGITEIKAVPHVPWSHPFVERLIGTIRREYLDHVFFWNAVDLQRKLLKYAAYYNANRGHASLAGTTPSIMAGEAVQKPTRLETYAWESHCGGLFELPVAA